MIVHISGKTRRGKTSLVVAWVIDMLNGTDDERYIEAVNYINELRRKGIEISLPKQRHVVSANIDIRDTYPNVKAYKVSGFRLGMPNKEIRTERLIPHGVYVLDECAKYYKYNSLKPWVLRMFELSGQYFMLFYLISHRYIGVNKDLRALIDKFVYVTESQHTYKIDGKIVKTNKYLNGGELLKTTWYYKEFDDEGDLELYLKSTSKDKRTLGKNCTYTYHGDIKSHYDAYNFKKYFEEHPNDFTYSLSEDLDDALEPKSWNVEEGKHD